MTALEIPSNHIVSDELLSLVNQLADTQPRTALAVVRALGAGEMPEWDRVARRAMETIAADSRLDAEIDATVFRARRAQDAFANWNEARVDALLRDLAEAFAREAESFAAATVKETGLGNVTDKALKNRFASLTVCESLAGKVGQGALSSDAARRVTELASPVGVVFAVVPVTNPVETAIFKALIALKARNAVILSFHHDAMGVGQMAAELMQRELAAHGAPTDLVQVPPRVGRKTTERFMRHPGVSLILATGGSGLVRAAYSSGKPAIGVGPGNAPAWICADANLEWAAQSVVWSKSFDNGLICGAEHSLVVDQAVATTFAKALEHSGAAVLTFDEREQFFTFALDPDSGSLRRKFVGQSAAAIAAVVGIHRPFPIEIIVMDADARQPDAFSTGEKLAPVLSLFRVRGDDEALNLCESLLRIVGAGHTAVIHSTDTARVERFARAMPVGRILVNTPGAQGCCGMTTGLECSLTLGCGTFGGNSTTDNVTFRHLMNVKRVAYNLD